MKSTPHGSNGKESGKESVCSAGDLGSIPGLGRYLGEDDGNPLQYSCLGNSMDRGAWWATSPWGHKESNKNEKLFHFLYHINLLFAYPVVMNLTFENDVYMT